jgi:hypothetical protein
LLAVARALLLALALSGCAFALLALALTGLAGLAFAGLSLLALTLTSSALARLALSRLALALLALALARLLLHLLLAAAIHSAAWSFALLHSLRGRQNRASYERGGSRRDQKLVLHRCDPPRGLPVLPSACASVFSCEMMEQRLLFRNLQILFHCSIQCGVIHPPFMRR